MHRCRALSLRRSAPRPVRISVVFEPGWPNPIWAEACVFFENGGLNSETSAPKLLNSQRSSLGSYSVSMRSAFPLASTSVTAGVSVIDRSICHGSNETIGGREDSNLL